MEEHIPGLTVLVVECIQYFQMGQKVDNVVAVDFVVLKVFYLFY